MAQMTKFPACWDEIQQKINNLVHETKYFHENKQQTSFVLVRNGLCGEIYKIFVNDGDPELTAFMEAHEIGHIIFGHIKNNTIKNAINKVKVNAAYKAEPPRHKGFLSFVSLAMPFLPSMGNRY